MDAELINKTAMMQVGLKTIGENGEVVGLWTDPLTNQIYRQMTLLEVSVDLIKAGIDTGIVTEGLFKNCPTCKSPFMMRIPKGFAVIFERTKPPHKPFEKLEPGHQLCFACFRRENPTGTKAVMKLDGVVIKFFREIPHGVN